MFPYKTLVIARQLDELRSEASARRLAAASTIGRKNDGPGAPREGLVTQLVTPRLRDDPYPAR